MGKNLEFLDDLVKKASRDSNVLDVLCDKIVPVTMHLPIKKVGAYRTILEPALGQLDEGTNAYTYLLIVYSFLHYREAGFSEVVDRLMTYEDHFEKGFTPAQQVSVNALIGACYRSMGQTEFALEYFQRNVLYTEIVRKDHEYFYSLSLYHIAELYGELEDYDEMLAKHQQSIAFSKKTQNKDFYFRALNGVGRAHRGLKEYQAALSSLKQVDIEGEGKANLPLRARNMHDLGSLYAEIDQVDASLAYFEKALALRKEKGLVNASITTSMAMGRLLIDHYRLDEAIMILQDVLEEARRIDVQKKQYEICRLLSEAFEKKNDVKMALSYFKEFHAIKTALDDVYYTQAENQRMREVNTLLEEQNRLIEEQKIQIESSHHSIQELNKNLEALVDARTMELTTRNQQLKHYAFRNAHEVRGPLSTILGLLEIAGEFKTIDEKTELIQMLSDSAKKLDQTVRDMHTGLITFNEDPE